MTGEPSRGGDAANEGRPASRGRTVARIRHPGGRGDRRGSPRPGVSRQALPHPLGVDGEHAAHRGPRARGPHLVALHRPRTRRHRGLPPALHGARAHQAHHRTARRHRVAQGRRRLHQRGAAGRAVRAPHEERAARARQSPSPTACRGRSRSRTRCRRTATSSWGTIAPTAATAASSDLSSEARWWVRRSRATGRRRASEARAS